MCVHRGEGIGPGSAHLRNVGQGAGQGWVAPNQGIPVPVNEGIEGQAVSPACGEILDVYLRVTSSMEGRDRSRNGKVRREERGRDRHGWMDGWTGRYR